MFFYIILLLYLQIKIKRTCVNKDVEENDLTWVLGCIFVVAGFGLGGWYIIPQLLHEPKAYVYTISIIVNGKTLLFTQENIEVLIKVQELVDGYRYISESTTVDLPILNLTLEELLKELKDIGCDSNMISTIQNNYEFEYKNSQGHLTVREWLDQHTYKRWCDRYGSRGFPDYLVIVKHK